MKKILYSLLSLFIVCGLVWAASTTTNYSLYKPGIGDTDWGASVNTNFDTIDTQMKTNADAISTHTSDNTQAHSDYLLNNANDTTSGTITAAGFIGDLTGNVTGNVSGSSGSTTGNAATATALAANPTDCSAGEFANAIDASGNLTCAAPAGGGSGDVTSVGDCESGACLDGTSDGGTWIKFYDAQGAGQLITGDLSEARVWTLPNVTGTVALTSNIPTDATYITQTANGTLSAEQALSSLSSGIMRVATTTGVITSLTDSAGIAANISDETGTGVLVFATSPTLVTPTLGVAAATSINKVAITAPATSATLTIADGKTLTATNTVNLNTMTDGKWCKYTSAGTVLDCNVDPVTDTNTTYTAGGTLLDLTGTTFSIDEGTLTNNKLCTYVSGTGIVCNSDDANTTYTAGDYLTLTGTDFDLDAEIYTKTISFVLESPTDADAFLIWKAPYALTITDIDCITKAATSAVIDIQECDSAGANCATVDATITCDSDGAADDGSLTNGAIDANDWIKLDIGTVTGTVGAVTVTIKYTPTD